MWVRARLFWPKGSHITYILKALDCENHLSLILTFLDNECEFCIFIFVVDVAVFNLEFKDYKFLRIFSFALPINENSIAICQNKSINFGLFSAFKCHLIKNKQRVFSFTARLSVEGNAGKARFFFSWFETVKTE